MLETQDPISQPGAEFSTNTLLYYFFLTEIPVTIYQNVTAKNDTFSKKKKKRKDAPFLASSPSPSVSPESNLHSRRPHQPRVDEKMN